MPLSWKRWLTGWNLRPSPARRRHRRAAPSVEALEDRTVPSTLIPVTNHRDLVFDATRGLLDITTASGIVRQFNVSTQTLLTTPLTVGTSLEGADIAPDGSALYVTEGQTSSGQGALHKVDLTTGAVTNLVYPLAFYESGSFDIGIGAGGKGLFDSSFAGSGWVPLRQVDLATGTLSTRTDDPGSGGGGQVRQNTQIYRSADRSLFLFTESNISSGPLFTYNALTDTFSRGLNTNVFLDNAPCAVNRNGSLLAVTENGGVTVMDRNFNVVRVLPYVTGGITFDPVRDVLYAVNPNTGQIQAYDTNTWLIKYQMAIGESYSGAQALGNGVMTTSSDGSLLFLSTASGVREYNLQVPTGNQFVVSGFPTSDSAGTAGAFSVTAEDAQGNVLTSYTGTVHLSSSDSMAQLPANYTFTAADAGAHTFSATLVRAGVQSITATDTTSNAVTGTEGNIVVSAGAVASIGFTSGVQGSYTAGGAINLNLLVQDTYGNAVSGYRGTVHFTTTDGQASLPADYTFTAADGGTHSFTGLLKTAGTQSVTVIDTANSALTATRSGLNVVPASTSTFTVAGYPATTAGLAQTFTVTSRDTYGNRTTLYSGTVHFTSSDLNAILPANYTFTSADQGAHAFSATLKSAGTQSLSASDTGTVSFTGSETGITVSPAAAARLSVSLSPDASIAGQALSLSMAAVDPYGNLATGYTGTVHFTSTDPQAALPADYTFTAADAGRHTFTNGVTLYTVQPPQANGQFVTATDTTTSSINGIGHDFVRPAAVSAYQFSAPAAVAAGSPFSVTLTAVDPYGNRATSYTGMVHFTSSDPAAVLPADYTFISNEQGSHTFTSGITLGTLGGQTVTATDAANGAITATATSTVNPEVQGLHFAVSPSVSTSTAGTPFGLTVTALDGNGNVASGYTGTVTFATSDTGARVSLPTPYTFSAADAGVHTFGSFLLVTAGSQTITACDQGITDGSSAGSASVQINPSSARTFSVAGFPTPVTAGTAGTITITALDAFGNVASGYAGTVHFTSSDAQAGLPADYTFTAADGGVHAFSATLKTAAVQSIKAADTGPDYIFGTQSGITVVPSSAVRLAFTLQGPIAAGVASTFTVAALDAYGNLATGYRGTVHFTSSDAQASLPADYTWTGADNGQHTFSAALVLKTVGSQTVTATDTATPSVTGATTQTVVAGPVVAVYAFTNPQTFSSTAGQAFTITAEAEDAYGNAVTNFTGTIYWSSSDRQALLPSAYTFTTADKGIHTFANATTLRTAGWQSVTASWSSGQYSSNSSISDHVIAAAASRVQLAAPSSSMAGSPFAFTVTAFDTYGNVASGFAGTAHFTSSDHSATLPADYTFTGADAGVRTFSNGATLDTAGPQTVSISAGGFSGSASMTITPAAATHFRIAAPASGTAGTAFNVTVTALDAFGNVATGYAGTVHFTSSDGSATLPADYAFTAGAAGTHAFINGVTLVTAGSQSVTATDAARGAINGSATVAVNAAAAVGFHLTAPAAATAGSPSSITVSALDGFGNVATGFAGTVHFASSDQGAALPADYAFQAGDAGTRAFTNGVTLVTAGSQSLTVSAAGITSGAAGISVSPAAAASLFLAAPATTTAGTAFTVTLTAHDAYGNVASGYAGTVLFTSSDRSATLPAAYTFTSADAGAHTFNNGVTLVTAGSQSIAAADSASSFSAWASVGVSAAAAGHFVVSAPPASTAGVGFDAMVTALDAFNNVAIGYTGTVQFTSSDGSATLPSAYTFTTNDAGVHTFPTGVTLVSAGNQTVTATDTASAAVYGSASVQVGAAATYSFTVSAPATTTAGSTFNVTVTAKDRFGNLASGYIGTAHFSSSDGQAALPADYTFTTGDSGAHTFSVTLKTAGNQSLTATDTNSGALTGGGTITVGSAAASTLAISAPATATAGGALTVTATARDSFGNTATTYTGTVHFTSSDGGSGASAPADYAFVAGDNGVHTFTGGVTFVTAGNQGISATDTISGSITGRATVSVSAAAASHYAISAPTSGTAGTLWSVSVTALDAFGNVATGYAGTVHFTSSDAQAGLPADAALSIGTGTFSATLKTAGTQFITATDTATASVAGAQTGILVSPASASSLTVAGYPTPTTAGVAGSFTVTLRDAFGNVASGYAGTVHFTSSDGQAALPADHTFTTADGGTHTFSVTLKTAGSQFISATDTNTGSLAGNESGITVKAAVATTLSESGYPASTTAGVAHALTVALRDPFGNVASGYTGTVHFTSSDGQAGLPADYTFTAADAGTHTFSVTLKTAGTQSISVRSTATSSLTATQSGVAVNAAAAAMLSVGGYPASTTAGTAHVLTVTARDAYGNVATGYSGTVHFTSSDAQAGLPNNYTFTANDAGVHTFTVTLKTAGGQSITAADTTTGTISGTESGISVIAAAATHLSIQIPTNVRAGVPFTITVVALDAFGNVATGYTGTVHFTSSDRKGILPPDYTFTTGDAGVHSFTVTLKSVGTESITATDKRTASIAGSGDTNVSR